MDHNKTFIQFPAAGFAPPFVPGFRSFSISSGRERMVSWTKACQIQVLLFFEITIFNCTCQSGTFGGTITMVPLNNNIWNSVLPRGMKAKVVFCPIVRHFGKTAFPHYLDSYPAAPRCDLQSSSLTFPLQSWKHRR